MTIKTHHILGKKNRITLFVVLFLIPYLGFNQEQISLFEKTIASKHLNNDKKEIILDSLLFSNNSFSAKNIFEYSKWAKKNISLDKAILINKKGIQLIASHKTLDKYYQNKILKNLGYYYYLKKEYDTSLHYYKHSVVRSVDSLTSSRSYRKIGNILFLKGDFYNAEKKIRQSYSAL